MSNFLYGRKYRVLVANKNNTALDVSNLRCTFRVEKSASPIANCAEVTIYNLSVETQNTIIEEGYRLIIEAGYQGHLETKQDGAAEPVIKAKQYGKIFDGEIVQSIWDKEDNVDFRLTLVALDGDAYLNTGFVKITVAAGQDQKRLVQQLASSASIPTEVSRISPDLSTKTLPRGKVFFGMPKDYLRDIARDNNANFWVDNGQVVIAKVTDIPPGQALVVSPQNGLIGTPQQTQDGVEYKLLLNPAIELFTFVKIDNSVVRRLKLQYKQLAVPLDEDGQYQTIRLIHVGDTRGDEWYTEVTGISRHGKGALPALMANQNQNPNR